jgi:hypothetical protein
MKWWGRKTAEISRAYRITLYHDLGNIVTLDGISNTTLDYVRNNVGRDKILTTDGAFLNLSKFSLVNYVETKQNVSTDVKISRMEEQ